MKRALPSVFLILLTACSREELPFYNSVPPFKLTSQTGAAFDSVQSLKGHPWIADFIYTNCPGPCPRMSSIMRKLGHELDGKPHGAEIRYVSFSVDPERDTPAVLSAYAKALTASADRWYFLTGPAATLQLLDRQAFLLGDVGGQLEHSTRFVLVDKQARVRGYYDSLSEADMDKLKKDVLRLAEEPS